MSTRDLIRGLATATGPHPMRRADYRQPIRRQMLADVKADGLAARGAPAAAIIALRNKPIREWPDKVREKLGS